MDRAKDHAADRAAASEDRDVRLAALAGRASSLAADLPTAFELTPPQARDRGHLLGLIIGTASRRLHVHPSGSRLEDEQHRRGCLEIAALALALADEYRPHGFARGGVFRPSALTAAQSPRPHTLSREQLPAQSHAPARPEEQHSSAPQHQETAQGAESEEPWWQRI